MQSKGAIKLFAIVFALVCLYQLSFTFVTSRVEKKAKSYAHQERFEAMADRMADGNEILQKIYSDSIYQAKRRFYLDSMQNVEVYKLGIRNYSFRECKEREINLGLDLKGGMNVTLEVSVDDIIKSMAGTQADDSLFMKVMTQAVLDQRSSSDDFVTLFGRAFTKVDPNAQMAPIFITELKDKIDARSTNDEVLAIIRAEADDAVNRSFEILRTRIDRFGVTQPNIQKLQNTGRILVELPGIKEPARVRKLLQGTAQLDFYTTYEFSEVYNFIEEANDRARTIPNLGTSDQGQEDLNLDPILSEESSEVIDTTNLLGGDIATEGEGTLLDELKDDTTAVTDPGQLSMEEFKKENPLYGVLQPNFQQVDGQYYPGQGPIVGYSEVRDTSLVSYILRHPKVSSIFPRDLRFMWEVKPIVDQDGNESSTMRLIAIKVSSRGGASALSGDKVIDAFRDFQQNGQIEITMLMNSEGAKIWERLTEDNIKRSIAIVLDGFVYSFPTVQGKIPNGRSTITGQFDIAEADDLANILKAGKLPAPASIVQEEVVGPSLGKEAIRAGLISMIAAFIVVLLYMLFYYHRAGIVANLALVSNVFFLFGVLASLTAVLTLPGIAGIVLTLGMAVDANVIIYERIKEEIRAGKGPRLAISDGYKNAYSAIIDGNVTTLLTGIVLAVFGSGPVQGFATTLIIGILTSMFSAIFLSRLVFTWMLDTNKKLSFSNKMTANVLANTKFDFIGVRKRYYIISAAVILAGVVSLTFKGMNYGVDFSGGRTYVIRFDQDVSTTELKESLGLVFLDEQGNKMSPEVKTFGANNQVKVTTKYLIDNDDKSSDAIVEEKLFEGIQSFYANPVTYEEFSSDKDDKLIGRLSSQKVGPTIADDIKKNSVVAVVIALIIIFIYIAIRFRKWQFGLGGIAALFHDSLIVISLYSIFYGILPFSMEVDQAFIAAILTIIGYSINDSVIIFDRIREYTGLYPKHDLKQNMNEALNSTLARTLNTSFTTFLVMFFIFIFGGEVIRGFSFALMVGILIGTYSSLFVASPISYDLLSLNKKEDKVKSRGKRK